MPFGAKAGVGAELTPVRLELTPSPDDLTPKDSGMPEMFRRPRRQKYVFQVGQKNLNYQFINWSPATAICWNYTNQWVQDLRSGIFVPPMFLMGYPMPDGVGDIEVQLGAPVGQTQPTTVTNSQAIFWFFENEQPLIATPL